MKEDQHSESVEIFITAQTSSPMTNFSIDIKNSSSSCFEVNRDEEAQESPATQRHIWEEKVDILKGVSSMQHVQSRTYHTRNYVSEKEIAEKVQ